VFDTGYSAWETILAGKKQGLLCTLDLAGAGRVRLLAVHLEHRSEGVRIRAAELIEELRAASATPIIAAGDFNSMPLGFPCATPDKHGRTALSLLLDTGAWRTEPTSAPNLDDFTFPSTNPSSIIDWVLAPADWNLTSRRVTGGELSDHKAVIVHLSLPQPATDR
jgi:endonuclease/exonuclease/phosphatase family metal-dependent hydrolase